METGLATMTPDVSIILATFNRREITCRTLEKLFGPCAPTVPYEVLVVDNASTDGTAEAIRASFSQVRLISAPRNLGSCAKSLAVDPAGGRYILFLDDDSYPRPGSVERMIRQFDNHPRLGAAGFRVHLPDGRQECSAFPDVFVGCGVGFRADALREVGGLDPTLFMQAEEYDLSFRLVNAGWQVRTFGDLHVEHLKTPLSRRSERTVYYDIRNNLIVAARYLPDDALDLYRHDWLLRYGWLAAADRRWRPYWRGAVAGWLAGLSDRPKYARRRLSQPAFETLFRWDQVAAHLQDLAAAGARRIILADWGKNVLAFYLGAKLAGLTIQAIGDDHFTRPNRHYRNLPILTLDQALNQPCDAVVVANTSPVHAQRTRDRLANLTPLPVHCWFAADSQIHHQPNQNSPRPAPTTTDKTLEGVVTVVG
ncbi:MAG: glycosyltransferase [Phycisphaerae bacterium]